MIRSFVLDCSAAMTMCFEDEQSADTDSFWRAHVASRILVPPIWFLEVANALVLGERRGRLTPAQVGSNVAGLLQFGFEPDTSHSTHLALATLPSLCRATKLTAYDAAYLDMAMRHRVPLCTLDDALAREAKRCKVGIVNMHTGEVE
jgi:predicted nucleic acid-binding protein